MRFTIVEPLWAYKHRTSLSILSEEPTSHNPQLVETEHTLRILNVEVQFHSKRYHCKDCEIKVKLESEARELLVAQENAKR